MKFELTAIPAAAKVQQDQAQRSNDSLDQMNVDYESAVTAIKAFNESRGKYIVEHNKTLEALSSLASVSGAHYNEHSNEVVIPEIPVPSN